MALMMNVTIADGNITVSNAYIRIDAMNGSKDNIAISVNSYFSQQAFTDGNNYLKQQLISFVPSVDDGAVNFIKQGYEHLKTLQEFAGATDA